MQPLLISHSPDLKKLFDNGYDLNVAEGKYLLVHQIPYVTTERTIKYGIFVSALTLAAPNLTARPDHTVYFVGDTPCDSDGIPLAAIINNSQFQQLTPSISVNHYFSSKPASGFYEDNYQKIRTYAEILTSQARAIDPNVTPRPKKIENQKNGY